jgi:hypothetical protein
MVVFQSREFVRLRITGGVAMLVAPRVRGAIAVRAIDHHFSARHTIALGNLTRNAGAAQRRVGRVRGSCRDQGHVTFPFRDDATPGRTPSLS